MDKLESTKLIYLEDDQLLSLKAEVLKVGEDEDGFFLILDQTIFYPRGGGQGWDTGIIKTANDSYSIDKVLFKSGNIHHYGEGLSDSLIGVNVEIAIDHERRLINSKLHTAGHLIDVAMNRLGFESLIPTKGFHDPQGASVEYRGVIDEQERESLKERLETQLEALISKGYEVQERIVGSKELQELCSFVPEYLPKDKPIRIVSVFGDIYIPCGGTHVKNINVLGSVKIRKIKVKKGNTKIGYEIIY